MLFPWKKLQINMWLSKNGKKKRSKSVFSKSWTNVSLCKHWPCSVVSLTIYWFRVLPFIVWCFVPHKYTAYACKWHHHSVKYIIETRKTQEAVRYIWDIKPCLYPVNKMCHFQSTWSKDMTQHSRQKMNTPWYFTCKIVIRF